MQQTVVVKIGSSSLTSDEGGLNRDKIGFFAAELAKLRRGESPFCSSRRER
ncbi:hypothetical protein LJK87_17640 [Paenibacillus sp. P25]|nr:hypothetical protein LJK87_17640 [Paenibacillus sp. P25]